MKLIGKSLSINQMQLYSETIDDKMDMDVDVDVDVDDNILIPPSLEDIEGLNSEYQKMDVNITCTGFDNVKSPHEMSNTFSLNDNCYFCTVAALHNTTTKELVSNIAEMQEHGAVYTRVIDLFNSAGSEVNAFSYSDFNQLYRDILECVPVGESIGLTYFWETHGHMVTAKVVAPGIINLVDYQKTPVDSVLFTHDPEIISYMAFFKNPLGYQSID